MTRLGGVQTVLHLSFALTLTLTVVLRTVHAITTIPDADADALNRPDIWLRSPKGVPLVTGYALNVDYDLLSPVPRRHEDVATFELRLDAPGAVTLSVMFGDDLQIDDKDIYLFVHAPGALYVEDHDDYGDGDGNELTTRTDDGPDRIFSWQYLTGLLRGHRGPLTTSTPTCRGRECFRVSPQARASPPIHGPSLVVTLVAPFPVPPTLRVQIDSLIRGSWDTAPAPAGPIVSPGHHRGDMDDSASDLVDVETPRSTSLTNVEDSFVAKAQANVIMPWFASEPGTCNIDAPCQGYFADVKAATVQILVNDPPSPSAKCTVRPR